MLRGLPRMACSCRGRWEEACKEGGKGSRSRTCLPSHEWAVLVCVCEREGAACMVHTGPGGRQHAPSASQASSLALIKAQARLCRSQRGRFNHRFTSSFSPIWRPLLPLLLSDTFFVSRLSLNSFQGGKRPRVDFSRRLQGAHEARLIIKRLLWRRRFHRLCCHTHTLQKKKKNQIRFLFSITLTCLLVHT